MEKNQPVKPAQAPEAPAASKIPDHQRFWFNPNEHNRGPLVRSFVPSKEGCDPFTVHETTEADLPK